MQLDPYTWRKVAAAHGVFHYSPACTHRHTVYINTRSSISSICIASKPAEQIRKKRAAWKAAYLRLEDHFQFSRVVNELRFRSGPKESCKRIATTARIDSTPARFSLHSSSSFLQPRLFSRAASFILYMYNSIDVYISARWAIFVIT